MILQALRCPSCGSDRLYRDGHMGLVQRWLCRACSFRFSDPRTLLQKKVPQFKIAQTVHQSLAVCAEKSPKNTVQVLNLEEGDGKSEFGPVERSQKLGSLDVRDRILECALWLQKQGYSQATIEARSRLLRIMAKRGADLYDPESVKAVIARQQSWCSGRKQNAVDAYRSFLKMAGGKWEAPFYRKVSKIPFTPPEPEIDQLIAGCSARMATFLQLLKETGCRPGEAWYSLWNDVDLVRKMFNVTPEKGSNPRILPMSQKLVNMLESLPKTYGARVFSRPGMPLEHFRGNFGQQKARIAQKLGNSQLQRITFKSLRHFYATHLQHCVNDIFYVMQMLGHKNIKNTMIYIHLAEQLYKGEQQYIVKVARSQKDAISLIAAGFDFHVDWNGHKLFRKKKC